MKKRIALILAALFVPCAALLARDVREVRQEVQYTLPRTAVKVTVEVCRKAHYAGKFSAFSAQMLGLYAPREDTFDTEITKVKIEPVVEADLTRWDSLIVTCGSIPGCLHFTPQGYVSGDVELTEYVPGFFVPMPPVRKTEPLDSREVSYESAKAAADRISELRSTRYAILTGDTDATYSGQALGAASDELKMMEMAVLSDFAGEDEESVSSAVFTVVPRSGETRQKLPVFRICDKDGLLPAYASCGRQYFIEIVSPEIILPDNGNSETPTVVCRIPAVCEVILTDGVRTIASVRMPVYQLGAEVRYPVFDNR